MEIKWDHTSANRFDENLIRSLFATVVSEKKIPRFNFSFLIFFFFLNIKISFFNV